MANGNRKRNSSGGTVVKATLAALVLLIMAATLAVNFGGRANATGGGNADNATPPATEQPSAPPEASEAPETPAAETPAPETPSPEPEPTPGSGSNVADGTAADVGANLSVTVPEGEPVGDEYFDDAVFVGDSRTEGLRMYSGLTNARFFSGVGLSVDRVFTDQIVNLNGQYLTVADALRAADYGKVYIMLGMNELGWVYESVYADYYAQIIDIIRETHPDAVIYVQSILPVSQWKDGSNEVYTNANVVRLQKALCEICEEKGVYYLNVAEAVQDENGFLPGDATPDGMHLTAEYCKIWMEYLRTHTV